MGLAALSSDPFRRSGRIVWAAEINARYAETIQRNYRRFASSIGEPHQVPTVCPPVDLSTPGARHLARQIREQYGPIDLLLAGPPCQGFSLANRRSRSHDNPANRLSLRVVSFARILEPKLLVLENVPGIRTLRVDDELGETMTEVLQRRLRRLGYFSVIMLLDAAEYGVPQHRLRSFLIAARTQDVLRHAKSLTPPPTHGPGRAKPFVTVDEAINDLPPITNGNSRGTLDYAHQPRSSFQRYIRRHGEGRVTDHLTSNHSPYVLKRYRKIPPGGNWTAISSLLSNYTDRSRTHRNIYYRLHPAAPARTIGNFRKAMTIHPRQTRGLSLREAARLQSIPDWLSFSDPTQLMTRGVAPGLNAYQQQIGNAVSFLLTQRLLCHVVDVLGF
jgi:DNA-cytosine methyltransferase